MSRKPAVGFIFITLMLDIFGLALIVPILPELVVELSGGVEEHGAIMYGWLIGLYALMQFLFAPVLGSLSDRFGRRPVILLSLLGAGLDYFLLAWAPTLAWFFVGRIIAGITGANFAAATAYIADVSPPEKRAANFGLVGAAFGVGFAIGPAIGGWLGTYGLRWPFYAAGAVTLLNWLYGLLVLPESLAPSKRRAFNWARANPFGALLDLRRHPLVLGLAGSTFLTGLGHQVYHTCWVLYTVYRFGWGTLQTGLSLALVGVMSIVVQGGLSRWIIPKFGERRVAVICLGIGAVEFAAFGLAPEGWMMIPIIIFGSLAGLAGPAIQGIISNSVGDDEQGAVQGSLTAVGSVAGFIGPFVMAGLYSFFISERAPIELPGAPFLLAAILAALAGLWVVRMFRVIPQTSTSRSAAEN